MEKDPIYKAICVLKKVAGWALALTVGTTIALMVCVMLGYISKENISYIMAPGFVIMTVFGGLTWAVTWAVTYHDGSDFNRKWQDLEDRDAYNKNMDSWLKAIEQRSIFLYHIPETNDVIAFEIKDERTVDAVVYPIRKHRGDRFIVNAHQRCSARIILRDDQNIISEIQKTNGLPADIYEEFVDYISDDEIINPGEGRLALMPLDVKNISFREVK